MDNSTPEVNQPKTFTIKLTIGNEVVKLEVSGGVETIGPTSQVLMVRSFMEAFASGNVLKLGAVASTEDVKVEMN